MDKNQKTILIELMNCESMSGIDLSHAIQMSTRSVRTIIKNINGDICGAKIVSGTFGYKLIIEDAEQLLIYLQDDNMPQDEETRVQYLFLKFIDNQSYLKIEDLCEELYLSRTQIKQSIKRVRSYFSKYDISINVKSHHGMYLEGSELNKRRAIAHFPQYQQDINLYQQIKNIVLSSIVNADYEVSDDVFENLVLHIYIMYTRVLKQQYAKMEYKRIESIKKEKEYELACSIMTLMEKLLNMEYRDEEAAYLTMHLCGKNCKQKSHVCIDQEIIDIVEIMLRRLEIESQISFSADLNLQLALSLHLIPLIKRIQYMTYLSNPLVQDIKRNLIVAYELAVKVSEVINQKYNCILPDDEIAFFALHINLSLEHKKIDIHKKNILLICSSGVGSARLLEYFFKENFGNYIQKLKICSLHELGQQRVSQYDCIFTTVPIMQALDIPVFVISHIMNAQDTIHITHNLQKLNHNDVLQYFPNQLFFTFESFDSKEDAIHTLVEKCRQFYELPENFEHLVFEREELASTEFNDLIAFPHTHKPISSFTFVSVAVLKKPLLWKEHKVRIILLSSIENKVFKELDDFYNVISTLMSDQTLQWQLINRPTYSTLKKIIEGVIHL